HRMSRTCGALFIRTKNVSFNAHLVDRVTNVDSIVDELRSKGIHRELAANVYAEKTEQAKMRRLLDNTKSSAMADALLTALFAQQPLLMNELLSGHRA
uniref:CARD domain-containing protein n=1 Tax=Scleropages formosus TaxID=113540 RepID=A0A8C9RTK7_SCLFO